MNPWTQAAQAIHQTLGEPATYAPPFGDPVACTVIKSAPTQEQAWGQSAIVTGAVQWRVLASEVTPAHGGTLTVNGILYRIHGEPRIDVEGTEWEVDTVQL